MVPSSLVCCLGGHRVLKPMHPTKFLGCNSWTLPFPIPAGGQGPVASKVPEAGLGQPARVQASGPWTCSGHSAAWENGAALTFQQRGGAVNALSPKARPFCDRQVVPTEGGLRGSLLHAVPVP